MDENTAGRDYHHGMFPLHAARPLVRSPAQLGSAIDMLTDIMGVGEAAERIEGATAENIQSAPPPDMVVLPEHYARWKVEPIYFLVENLGPKVLVFNIIKYAMRYDAKNGVEDIRKIERYSEMLRKYVSGDPDWWQRPVTKETP